MKKRILSLVLALSMMISLFPVSALAQTPGGGAAALAEENGEDIDAANGADVTTIQIDGNGEPVGNDGANGKNWEFEDNLTLKKGTYTFSAPVTCGVIICDGATVAGGTFENTVWNGDANTKGGMISGGIFKKTITNSGIITGGVFAGTDLETNVINYADFGAGIITGGVFKVLPSKGIDRTANQYRIEFADTANTDTLSVNDVDFGTDKVYVVGMDNVTLNVGTTSTTIVNVNDTLNTNTYRRDIDFVPSAVRLGSETDSSTGVYLLKLNKTITKLEIGLNGYPITTGRETMYSGIYIAGHKGTGWTYGDSMLTLYGTNDGWDFSNDVKLQCEVKVSNSATLKGGVFNKWVANWGTIENGVYRANVTNYNGTVKNGVFLGDVGISSTGYSSTVQGGVFKNAPYPATGYTKHSITSYVSNRTIKVKIDGVSDFEDVGSSPVVVTKEGEGTIISVQLWESGTNGQATTIKSLNGKAIGPDNCNSSWDESTKTLKFTTPTTGNIELNGPLENAELEFESGYRTNGQYPVGTDGGKKNASGNGWEYVAGTGNELGTLTLTAGTYDLTKKQPTNSASEELHDPIAVKLTIGKDVVATNSSCWIEGTITVQNGGTIENGEYSTKDIVIETGGTIKNGTFKGNGTEIKNSGTIWNASCSNYTKVTNNAGGVIKDGKFRYNVTNNGGIIENGEFYYKVTNKGTIRGGYFRNGVDNTDTAAVVNGGIFNGGTGLEGRKGISKVDVNGVKINSVNGVSAGSGMSMSYWGNIYTTYGTQLELQTLDGGHIYNLNGKTDDYNVAGLGTKTVSFKMPREGVVLNKTATLTVKSDVEGAVSTKSERPVVINKAVLVTTDQQEGYYFAGWKVSDDLELTYNGEKVDLSKNYIMFDMPAENVTVTATYAKNPKYTLTVNGGYIDGDETKTSGDYKAGATIKLTAKDAAEGKEFDKWVLNGGLELYGDGELTNEVIWVTITGNATVKATYKDKAPTTYTLTVDGGYIGADKNQTSGKFKSKEQVEVTASAETGYHFTKWTVEEGTLNLSEEELKATPLTFEMPDGAVSLKANYEEDTPDPVDPNPTPNPDDQPKTYTITTDIYGEVNGGASATVKENDWVHMTVAEVPEGMTFDYWNIPDALLKALQKQNSGFRNNVESLSFQMPNMGEEEQTFAIKANFRSSELPGEDDGPSALGTMATVAVGGAAAGILVWQGVSLGVDSYLQLNLPKGVAVPANRRELVVLLWETAGKPETALPSLYSDLPAEEIELQKATRWAIDNGLVKSADDNDASRFDPDRYVTKYDVFGAWLKLKKLMK